MAPSDAFSTAANVFSVLGLADIVFKYGREVCETLSKLHNVPNEIKELLVEIECVKEHAARVKTHLEDLARSSLPQRSKDFTAPLEALLFHCHEELVLINKSISESTLSKQDGWLKKLRKNAKWVWDGQDITLARRRLARWRRELESTLTLAGRANDVSIYAEVASTRSDVAQAASDSKTAVSDLSTTASSIENGVHTISATMDTFFQGNNAQLGGMKDLLLDTQGATKSGNVQVLQKLDSAADSSSVQCSALQNDIRGGVNAVRRDVHTMSQSMRQSRRDQTRKQRSGTRKMLNKLEEVNANMTQIFASLNLTRVGETAFIFEGTNLELVTLPLELLHSELVKALPTLQSQTKIKMSQSEAAWVQQQFEMVRTASFELSANASRSRAAKGLPTATDHQPWCQQAVMHSSSACSVISQRSSVSASRRSIFYRRESLKTPLGCLNLIVIRSSSPGKDPEDTELESMTISFYPSEQFRLPGISANFPRRLPFARQHIPPTIRIWNIIPYDSPAFAAAAADDVYALTGLFESGIASPFDRTSDGYSLVAEAIKTTSCEVFKLLLEQGAGLSEMDSVDLDWDVDYLPCSKKDVPKLHKIFLLLSKHIPDFFAEGDALTWIGVYPFILAVEPSVKAWDFDFSDAELVSCLKSAVQLAIDNSIHIDTLHTDLLQSYGKSLEDVWPGLFNNLWRLPDYKKLIRAWDIDQLGDLAEIILQQSSVLREAWVHGMDVDDFFLMGVASLWE
ncbi:hypothetical protein SLS54_000565 [Diplodia seriata]